MKVKVNLYPFMNKWGQGLKIIFDDEVTPQVKLFVGMSLLGRAPIKTNLSSYFNGEFIDYFLCHENTEELLNIKTTYEFEI